MIGIKHFINLISINGLEDLWKKENPDSSEFIQYNRSSGTRSTIERAYTDIKRATLITSWYHLLIIIMLFLDFLDSWYFNSSPLGMPEFSLTTDFSFFIKNTKQNQTSASDLWENTKSSFKEDDGCKVLDGQNMKST